MRDVAVQLLLSTFLVVSLSSDSKSHSVRDGFDTHFPDLLVQLWVETNVLGSHVFSGELLDGLDCPWRSLLELHSVDVLVQMDGVVSGDDVVDGLQSQSSENNKADVTYRSRGLWLLVGRGHCCELVWMV